jgi:hypothetical protein
VENKQNLKKIIKEEERKSFDSNALSLFLLSLKP